MPTPVIIIIIGLFIFWGHYLNGIFERRSIPDVLGLMLIGILIGPVFQLIDPASFGKFGSLFSNLVLIFILFESGIDLRIHEIRSSFKESASLTFTGFITTWIITFMICKFFIGLPILTSLFIGSTLGGTSSAVVVGLIKKLNVRPKTSATLIMESAETDVFTLAIPLSILGLMITGNVQPGTVISQFISSLIMAVVLGIGGAFIWSFIITRLPTLKSTKFSTPAFLFIVYGLAEYLNFSGPLTALSFGIAIGNLHFIEPKILEKIIPNQDIVLAAEEKDFFGQIVFLLRTFFFVFIGMSIKIAESAWLLWGLIITAALYLVRLVVIRVITSSKTPMIDRAAMSIMIPKGLGAAVIATLPLQQGHPDGESIQSVCFSVILFSTIICAFLFFLLKTNTSTALYRRIFQEQNSSNAIGGDE
jgi:NhaP-type Na+/H+ or K+/H+ antiporter